MLSAFEFVISTKLFKSSALFIFLFIFNLSKVINALYNEEKISKFFSKPVLIILL